MPVRTANAEWTGDLESGEGTIEFGDGRFEESYSADSRFGEGTETNPEELLAAAHAACYSMALSHALAEAGYKPERIRTEARARLDKAGDGFAIGRIDLRTEAEAGDIDDEAFQDIAEDAKENCPVSKALAGCEIELQARLVT